MYSYNENYLMCDGAPILPVMGEFHFSRYPKEEWESALYNMKCGGIEIVATYVFWIHHEEAKGILKVTDAFVIFLPAVREPE